MEDAPIPHSAMVSQVTAAVLSVYEECAKLAEAPPGPPFTDVGFQEYNRIRAKWGKLIAQKIRARAASIK